jgi:hypothetical protein
MEGIWVTEGDTETKLGLARKKHLFWVSTPLLRNTHLKAGDRLLFTLALRRDLWTWVYQFLNPNKHGIIIDK